MPSRVETRRSPSHPSAVGPSLRFSSITLEEFWQSVCRVTKDRSHLPHHEQMMKSTPPPPSGWILLSMVLLALEASRHILLPLLFLLPIILDYPYQYTIPVSLTFIIILIFTKHRYDIDKGGVNSGVYGCIDETAFGRHIGSFLKSRLKSYLGAPLVTSAHWATAILFLTVNRPHLPYHRRWMITDDGQSIALDWFLPLSSTTHIIGVILVLHGLNGSSSESYLNDLYHTALPQGYALCCMIARGLDGTPIVGGPQDSFSGARVTDVRAAVDICHKATLGRIPLSLIGYSMGGIIAANMVAKYGWELRGRLHSCVSISGGISLWRRVDNPVSRELWQPMLAFEVKQRVHGPMVNRTGFSPSDPKWYDRPTDLYELDTLIPAAVHGYDDVIDYYHDMSACSEKYSNGGANIAIPTLLIHSRDDPIIHVEAGAVLPPTASKYLFSLITDNGGHVGWPQGWLPWKTGFKWVSETAIQFAETVALNWDLLDDAH